MISERITDGEIKEACVEDLVIWAVMEKESSDPMVSDNWKVHEDNYRRIKEALKKLGKRIR